MWKTLNEKLLIFGFKIPYRYADSKEKELTLNLPSSLQHLSIKHEKLGFTSDLFLAELTV